MYMRISTCATLLANCRPFRLDETDLPSSACLVWSLKTLVLKEGYPNQLVEAPFEFWKMRQLKHVKCDQVYLPGPPSGSEGLAR